MNCGLRRSSAVSLVTSLILDQPLIVPTVFHVWVNGRDARRKRARSGDHVDDQSLGRSCVRFSRSRAVKSRACLTARMSRDESRVRSRVGDFPGSCGRRFSLVAGH